MLKVIGAKRRKLIACSILIVAAGGTSQALLGQESSNQEEVQVLENIVVYGEPGKTDTATKLDLTVFETPQSISVVSQAQLQDFSLTNVNTLLDYVPGITVEEIETGRTYYTARGFDIVNFQYDGVGAPFTYGLNSGDQDTAIYEKVEVVKGAAGLISGVANPSATINYVRKRPTQELSGSTRVTVNDWDGYRIDADVSGGFSSAVRGRVVAAQEDTESYLDRHTKKNTVLYGVIDADLSPSTLLTVGHSFNRSEATGNLWGALPLVYTDGTPTDYDVSTNTATDWSYADTTRNQTFVELDQQLGSKWGLHFTYTANTLDSESELFYVYGTPDRNTELGLFGYASAYDNTEDQWFADLFVNGSFYVAGREQLIVLGYNQGDIGTTAASYYDYVNGFPVLGSDWAEGNSPQPIFNIHDPFADAASFDQEHKALYFSSRLSITDQLSFLIGARRAEVDQKGFNYGAESTTNAKQTVPYYGITYEVTDNVMLYASRSDVFIQQAWVDSSFMPLGATEGKSEELGIKNTFNDGLVTVTAAFFRSENHNLGEFDQRINGIAVYNSRDYDSEGYELEIAGEVITGLNLSAGYTQVEVEDQLGEEARPFIPQKTFKASAAYTLPMLPALKIGGLLKWQDDIENTHAATGATIEQKSYALLDLLVSYQISDGVSASVNVGNVTNEKYLNSIYWEQAFYGAPRNASASLTVNF